MNDTQFVFGLLTLLFVVSGLIVLLLRTGREEARAACRMFPVAALFQYRWGRYGLALCLFLLGAVSGLELLRQL